MYTSKLKTFASDRSLRALILHGLTAVFPKQLKVWRKSSLLSVKNVPTAGTSRLLQSNARTCINAPSMNHSPEEFTNTGGKRDQHVPLNVILLR